MIVAQVEPEPRSKVLEQIVQTIIQHDLSWDELILALTREQAARNLATVREVFDGEELEYKRLGNYLIAMRDLCGGQPVIRTRERFTRINAGVVLGWLEQGHTPEQVAQGYDIPLEAVLEVRDLAKLFDYDRSYA